MKYNHLGFVDTITKAAAGFMQPRAGAPGVRGAQPGQPGAGGPVTVSPAMQQAFTPQFSPTMTMQQDSPGASVTAAPTQTASPTQAARTGMPMPGGSRTPFAPGQPDYYPRERSPAFPEAFPDPFSRPAILQTGNGMSDLMKTGLLAVAAIGGIMLLNKPKKGAKK